jgi:hypothetical protein
MQDSTTPVYTIPTPIIPDDPYLPGADDGPTDPHSGIEHYTSGGDALPDMFW